jgi:hypothetical protein
MVDSPIKSCLATMHSMNEKTKARLIELMFHVVPDPDEVITDDVLSRCEAVDHEEGEILKKEFRSLIEALDHPDIRDKVLTSLDEMAASDKEAHGDDVEWMNVRDVHGRRIRRALAPILSPE